MILEYLTLQKQKQIFLMFNENYNHSYWLFPKLTELLIKQTLVFNFLVIGYNTQSFMVLTILSEVSIHTIIRRKQ